MRKGRAQQATRMARARFILVLFADAQAMQLCKQG
jgi:hypothetical protein